MAARASVEIGSVSLGGAYSAAIHGRCLAQEELVISGTTATTTMAVTAAQMMHQKVVRISTDDTGCYVAVGTTPDPTATTATAVTTARRWIPAGGSIELPIEAGDKFAVHS